ncbi:hypothetical protein VTK73DRAFT_3575 [Phialemonium thermophilum]|uniref:Septin-type G domain-containing protein n=1 Tax=Phialemonium thermophilum TaxID=223376 RepID=A0ABR3WY89_9PEZI
MRPMPGEAAFGRPRAADQDAPPTLQPPPSPPQMSFVLAEESTVDVALQQSSAEFQRGREVRKSRSRESVGTSFSSGSGTGPTAATATSCPTTPDTRPARSGCPKGPIEGLKRADDSVSRPDSPAFKGSAASNLSRPMTPTLFGTPGPASALSSVSSRRNSLVESLSEEMGTQILSTAMDTDKEPFTSMQDSGSVPQLIMPSIKMPSRRPFTDAGKALGRLKMLIAGDSGVGKTSLIKAIVQSCEHIVHVDPISPSPLSSMLTSSSPAPRRSSRTPGPRFSFGTTQITEVFASTKSYPPWWSDLDDTRVLARRKSLGDTVLDRNICFVDTPGYGNRSSAVDAIIPVVQYVESHLQRLRSNSVSDADILTMLGGDGGAQVDVVFYMVSDHLKPADIQYLRQLVELTNVIVLIAKADLLSSEQVTASKEHINGQLREANIRPFSFATLTDLSAQATSLPQCPYATSSAHGSDHEVMDASLLMSPDYVQPLVPTELSVLVERVFSPDGASWLRHSAAKKYIQWRKAGNDNASRPMALYQPLYPGCHRNGNTHPGASSASGASPTFALARVTDHMQREEQLAHIRLARWAADLQRSLDNERAHYEGLARNERAVWLTERLGECVQDGTLVPVPGRGSRQRREGLFSERTKRRSATQSLQHQDPLGLLEVAAEIRHKGLVALEVLGSLSVLGGLALWLSKHYWYLQPYEWAVSEWDKFWYGGR